MNRKEIRKLSREVKQVRCTNCGMQKYIVPFFIELDDKDVWYNAYDLDVTSRCCKKPDYRL